MMSMQGIENNAGVSHVSWVESMKDYISDYRVWLPEVALYGGVAFLVGFLLKNFGRYIVAATLVALLTILALQYTNIITVSLAQIAETIGLPGVTSLQEGVDLLVLWVQTHVFGAVSIVLGFALGWMIG